jgi:Zn finger protein HypA/HybF involved in hydrogenase expression
MPSASFATSVIDLHSAAPAGKPCEACGTPVEPLDKFCPACGTPNPDFHAPSEPSLTGTKLGPGAPANGTRSVPATYFRCQQCGAEVATDPNQRSYVCPFCDSTYVLEFSPDQTGRQPPEFVIGFALTPDQAQAAFYAWLRKRNWFRPGDLAAASVADKLKGIYLPFWSFTMLAQSQWQAQIGEYWYRTETYTTTDSKGNTTTHTRQVQETEWWPLAGRHHRYYSGYLVSGSKGLAQDQSLRIQPFNLPALKRYEPYFLAGWLAEEYSVGRDDALAICRAEFQRQENQNVGSFLPGDTHRSLSVATEFSHVSSDLCLLPVYILSYRYRDKVYRFLLNGQTGKMAGDKPLSGTRIAMAIAAALFLIVVIALAAAMVQGPKSKVQSRPPSDLPAEAPPAMQEPAPQR